MLVEIAQGKRRGCGAAQACLHRSTQRRTTPKPLAIRNIRSRFMPGGAPRGRLDSGRAMKTSDTTNCLPMKEARVPMKEARVLHSDPPRRLDQALILHFTSCGLGSPSRFCRSFLCGLCYVLCSMHHHLAQLEHLRLSINEVGLNLREFLRFPYMNDLASTHERI